MAWCYMKALSKRARLKQQLRPNQNPDLLKLALATKAMREDEFVEMIIINSNCHDGKVVLEFWCKKYGERGTFKFTGERHTVFSLAVEPNPDWIVERN